MKDVPAYSILAAGYDVVMDHVDYGFWATYVHRLLKAHHPEAERLLELGCGTGSLAIELQPLGDYHYVATDRSPEMIAVARTKVEAAGLPVRFETADFTDYAVSQPVDVVLLLYDSVNYLLEEDAIAALLKCTHEALEPGGVFIFDQSTVSNSLENERYFEDEREVQGFYFRRRSSYDPESCLHTTSFVIEYGGHQFREEHVQRAYSQETVRELLADEGFSIEQAYDGFTEDVARPDSERVQWVVRK